MNAPAINLNKPVREQVSKEEWQARVDLAACYRLMAEFGMVEMVANHISVRVPGTHDQFLINPYGMLYEEMTASSMLKIDLEGNVLFNATDYGVNQAGFVIHSAVHAARHDVECIIHTHTLAGMAVSTQACGLLPIHMYAHNFYEALSYHDYEGPSMRLGERERIVASLGANTALMLRNHGLLTVGETMPAAWIRMWRLERACQIQLAAQAGGRLVEPSPEMCRQSQELGNEFLTDTAPLGELEFAALRRIVDEKDSGYRSGWQ